MKRAAVLEIIFFLCLMTVFVSSGIAQQTDSITDMRDGQKYKTVKIGRQLWMAQNLNYKTTQGSWCYENKQENCHLFGRLYNWETSFEECPYGWRLPSINDFEILLKHISENTDNPYKALIEGGSSGFSALLGGLSYGENGFITLGAYGGWWSSSEESDGFFWNLGIHSYSQDADMNSSSKPAGLSVRCISDKK